MMSREMALRSDVKRELTLITDVKREITLRRVISVHEMRLG